MIELIRDGHLGGFIRGGDVDTFDPILWDRLIQDYQLTSIIDVGCGEGWSTKHFKDQGLDALGIEGSRLAIDNSPVKDLIIQHDYTTGPYEPIRVYDAVWSCEFVEHVEAKYVPNFLRTFLRARRVFMTYSTIWDGGYHHVNANDQTYWNQKLKEIGFNYDEAASLKYRALASARWVKATFSVYEINLPLN